MKRSNIWIYFLLTLWAMSWSLSLSAFADSPADCQFEIRVNDPAATIFLDGIKAGESPFLVGCKSEPQLVRIEAPGKEVFVRALPAAVDFKPENHLWNVQLQMVESEADGGNRTVSLRDPSQEQVLRELRRLQQVVDELRLAMPVAVPLANSEGASLPGSISESFSAPVVNLDSPAPKENVIERAVSSLGAAIAVNGATHLRGFYVQLHALLENQFDEASAISELESVKAAMSRSHLHFCKSRVKTDSPDWTHVYFGPVKNRQVARKITRRIGRGTFVVRNPDCVSQPKPNSQVAN